MPRITALIATVVAAALGGCASAPAPAPEASPAVPGSLFAVVPGSNGHVGRIVVYRGGESRVIDTAYGAERIDSDGTARTQRLTAEQVRADFGETLAALPPKPATFTLYFLEGRDELTAESRAELDRMIRELKRRPIPDIVLIGHTDTVGSADYNDRLSLMRAERARELLATMGLERGRMQVAGRGKRELLVPTAENVAEARNRRVEINVR